MDDFAKRLEEFGSITMSMPVLSRPDDRMAFDLHRASESYFTEAKQEVQGGAAVFEQVVMALALGASSASDSGARAAHADELERYQAAQLRERDRQQLLDSAARDEFMAAVERANREEDAVKRGEMLAEAKRKYADAMAPSPGAPTQYPRPGETTPATSTPPPGPTEAIGVLANDKFAGFQQYLKDMGTDPTTSNRDALVTAAGDKTVEAIFNILGRPDAAQTFEGTINFFGVSMVSVIPGWRTQTDFAADLEVRPRLVYRRARKETVRSFLETADFTDEGERKLFAQHSGLERDELPRKAREALNPTTVAKLATDSDALKYIGNTKDLASDQAPDHPGKVNISAVTPMTEAQELDLASSYRRRTQLAMSLSAVLRASGLNQQANAFQQFVRQREIDVATRTQEAHVAAYSTANLFGYQVGPALTAIGNAASRKPKPEYRLTRQTFPVLLLGSVDDVDVGVTWFYIKKEGDTDARLVAFESALELTQSPRWVPLRKKARSSRNPESELIAGYGRIDDHAEVMGTTKVGAAHANALRERAGVSIGIVRLPADLLEAHARATLRRAFPSRIVLAHDTKEEKVSIVLTGEDLEEIDSNRNNVEVVGTASITLDEVIPTDSSTLEVKLTVKEKGGVVLVFMDREGNRVAAPPLDVVRQKAPDCNCPKGKKIEYLVAAKDGGTTRSLVLPEKLEASDLAAVTELMRADIEKDKPPPVPPSKHDCGTGATVSLTCPPTRSQAP